MRGHACGFAQHRFPWGFDFLESQILGGEKWFSTVRREKGDHCSTGFAVEELPNVLIFRSGIGGTRGSSAQGCDRPPGAGFHV